MIQSIPFNKPYLHGRELVYISQAVANGKISGDGAFTAKCHEYFTNSFKFKNPLLTTSCTDALEMCSILVNIKEGDEFIVPSFTFVSTANAFVLRGATPIFADSNQDNPNIDHKSIEGLITSRTRAIVVVHYAGIACDMDPILEIGRRYNIPIIEDAAQGIDSFYKGRLLGSMGALSTFSFHETKNIVSGEGGMLIVNDDQFKLRAEIIREKGTNRSSFFRGEVDKYGWVDIGSSFLPSDIIAAYLYAQLENLEKIQFRRKEIWRRYWAQLSDIVPKYDVQTPMIPEWATNNGHMFYLVCKDLSQRTFLIDALKSQKIHAVFHYQSLHASPYFNHKHDGRALVNSDKYSDCILRLPLYYELSDEDVDRVVDAIISSLKKYSEIKP